MKKIKIRYNRITYSATAICLICFCIFVIFFERKSLHHAQSSIDDHARVIADDLWSYNYQGASEYLKLAATSQNYETLVVTDHNGEIFEEIEIRKSTQMERLLSRFHLIPQVKLVSYIEHRGKFIGWIEAVWRPRTFFFYLYVFFALVMVVVVIHLYTRVIQEKRLLEERVHERTTELLRSNVSLREEITERKRVEEALRDSEEKHRLLAENINDVIWTMNMDLQYTYISPAAVKLHGWSLDELVCLTIEDFLTPSSLENAYKAVGEQLSLAEKNGNYNRTITIDMEMFRKDGSTLWTEVTASFIIGKDDKAEGILGVTRDISERIREQQEKDELRQKLDRSKKMESLGLLAGGVAHDLNNVLSGIVSYPDLLLMDLPEDSNLKAPIQTIKDSGQKAATIVQDLLTLARRGVIAMDVLGLNDVITEYLQSPEQEKLSAYHKNVKIQTELEKNLPNIKGSPVHLKKTIMNLVSNAMESQTHGGMIMISTESRYLDRTISGYETVKQGDYVVVKIEDRGEGIDETDLYRIFEPFYTKKVMGRSGTGLGMAVVWGTVQDHKGYIDIHSVVGEGTIFELYFPITREDLSGDVEALSLEDLQGSGESILVIDDVAEQREIASKILEKLNYSVQVVYSGEDAVEFLKNYHVDLVIIDMIMDPGIDGLETYKRILQFKPEQKAIIASGFAETDRVKEAQRLGAGEYVKKPYMLGKIGVAIKTELAKNV